MTSHAPLDAALLGDAYGFGCLVASLTGQPGEHVEDSLHAAYCAPVP